MQKKIFILLSLWIIAFSVIGQNVVINEMMSQNGNTLQDSENEYPDWIELFNGSESAINLENYHLSDDVNNLDKWTFPSIEISAGGFLVIFASDKNLLDPEELHTNFKLSSSGETVYLIDDTGQLIDASQLIGMGIDESYCRIPDGSPIWNLSFAPSPGNSNTSSNVLDFSHQEGLYPSAFSLIISSSLGDTIFYTLNGDIPNRNSLIYADSLYIEEKDTSPNTFSEIPSSPEQYQNPYKAWESPDGPVKKATVIRCVSFHNGERTSKTYTKSFFIRNDGFDSNKFPVVSLVTASDNLFNSDSGIYIPGNLFNSQEALTTGNYLQQGKEWERAVHIEYFENDGSLGFSQNAGVRIHGGRTRLAAQKSLRLYAREEYGEKHFQYQLFPNKNVDQYKRFILRTSMASWYGQTIIKDILAQDISSNLDVDYQDFQPVDVYINGEYWGVHTVRDRIDERYIAYTHDLDKDSIEFYELTNPDFLALLKFIELSDLSNEANYEHVAAQINIENYIDYNIAQQFFSNFDWPGNNSKCWRQKPDGKWRWVLYDLDAGFGLPSYNMLTHATLNDPSVNWPNSPSATLMFRKLIENESFRNQFIYRYAEVLCNDFSIEIMLNKLKNIEEMYKPSLPDHMSRWHFPSSLSSWENELRSDLSTYLSQRAEHVRYNLTEFFNIETFNFECEPIVGFENDILIRPNPISDYFQILNNHGDLEDVTLAIFNINGSLVHAADRFSFARNERKYINVQHLGNGTYILKITSNEYNQQSKLVVIN